MTLRHIPSPPLTGCIYRTPHDLVQRVRRHHNIAGVRIRAGSPAIELPDRSVGSTPAPRSPLYGTMMSLLFSTAIAVMWTVMLSL